MGSLDFEPLHPDFGARVRGVSLVGEIADETVEEIKRPSIPSLSFVFLINR